MQFDDGALGERVRNGDDAAFALLYERYAPRLYDFAARLVRDHVAAEDLVQTAFTRAYERRTALRDPSKVKSWLFTTLHNLAMNQLERRPATPIEEQWDLAAPGPGPEAEALTRDAGALVWAAAASLEPRQYAVLDMSVRQELSSPEIADVLGVPAAHAAVLVNRAREALGNAVRYLMVARRREHCERLAELVPAGVRVLTPEQRSTVDHHMRHCDACQVMARKLTAPAEILAGLAPVPLPTRLTGWPGPGRRGRAAVRRSSVRAHPFVVAAIATVVVVGAVGGGVFALQHRMSPPAPPSARPSGVIWHIDSSPPQPGGLAGVGCSSATSCTAVGSEDTSASSVIPLVEQWDGAHWAKQPAPVVPGGALSAVACQTMASCIAVGSMQQSSNTTATLAMHWDGTGWATKPTPNPAGAADTELSAVACVSINSCMAVGYFLSPSLGVEVTMAERWDGLSWTIESTPNPFGASQSTLAGVACTRADSCIAVGSFTSAQGTTSGGTLAEQWNGRSWVIQPTPNGAGGSDSALAAVTCTSKSGCVAVGGSGAQVLVERWNGTIWNVQASPTPAGAVRDTQTMLNGVECPTTTHCVAVGEFIDTPATGSRAPWKAFAERWDGTGWAIEAAAIPSNSVVSILAAVACPSSSSCIAVGNFATSALAGKTLFENE